MLFEMNMLRPDPAHRLFCRLPQIALLAVAFLVVTPLLLPSVAYANVYATAIKLNGGFTNAVAGAGTSCLVHGRAGSPGRGDQYGGKSAVNGRADAGEPLDTVVHWNTW